MRPRIGQICIVRGLKCRVIAIEPAGTIVVESIDGKRWYRVSGLAF